MQETPLYSGNASIISVQYFKFFVKYFHTIFQRKKLYRTSHRYNNAPPMANSIGGAVVNMIVRFIKQEAYQ